MIIGVTAVGIAVVGGIGAYFCYYFVLPGVRMGCAVDQLRIRLLCETDHQALLEAGRELSRRVVSEGSGVNTYIGADVSQLPEPIPSLRPHHVTIDRDGLVKIEMYTGWSPLGVYVFPEGHEKPSVGYGQRRLLEGLWYYDDGYSVDPAAYDKVIDAILVKCGKMKAGKPGT